MAAVLASGPAAALSHRSAAALHGLLRPGSGATHVTVPRKVRSRRGLTFHRAHLPADEIERVEGITVTGVSRTLFDLAGRGGSQEIERALHEAEVRRLDDRLSLDDLITRYPRRAGAARVRAALANRRIGSTATRNDLEELFLALLRNRDLPRPEINVWLVVGGDTFEVDCLWRDPRLVVELDGRSAHDTVRAFEQDRRRDRVLQAAGWRVLRITWRQLHDEPDAIATDLSTLLRSNPIRV